MKLDACEINRGTKIYNERADLQKFLSSIKLDLTTICSSSKSCSRSDSPKTISLWALGVCQKDDESIEIMTLKAHVQSKPIPVVFKFHIGQKALKSDADIFNSIDIGRLNGLIETSTSKLPINFFLIGRQWKYGSDIHDLYVQPIQPDLDRHKWELIVVVCCLGAVILIILLVLACKYCRRPEVENDHLRPDLYDRFDLERRLSNDEDYHYEW